ncbi:MAG: transglutaminase-like domain-containing protein [Desulfurococcaceae archaeon]
MSKLLPISSLVLLLIALLEAILIFRLTIDRGQLYEVPSESGDYEKLFNNYTKLMSDYEDLKRALTALTYENSLLKDENTKLRQKLTLTSAESATLKIVLSLIKEDSEHYRELSKEIIELSALINSYCCIPSAIPRVLNSEEIKAVREITLEITGNSIDVAFALNQVYNYIVKNIRYVEDPEIPIVLAETSARGSETLVTKISTRIIKDYVQTPSYTIASKVGDCDDMAILAYAMIKAYVSSTNLSNIEIYLMAVEFSSGEGHVAVMVFKEGSAIIVDPAGKYISVEQGSPVFKPVNEEILSYNNYWRHLKKIDVIKITIYSIDVDEAKYALIASGSISDVIKALSSKSS